MRQKIPVGCCANVYGSTLYNCPPRVCDLSHDDGLKQRSGNTSYVSPTSREQQTVLQWANYNNAPQSIVHLLTAQIWEEKPSGPRLAEPLAPSVKNMAVTATSLTPRCCFKAVAILECQPPPHTRFSRFISNLSLTVFFIHISSISFNQSCWMHFLWDACEWIWNGFWLISSWSARYCV